MGRGPISTSNYLQATPVLTAYPFTISLWIYEPSGGTGSVSVAYLSSATPSSYDGMGVTTTGIVSATSFRSGGSPISSSAQSPSSTMLYDEWVHIAGVFASDSSRAVFFNGTKYSDTTTVNTSPGTNDRMDIANFQGTTVSGTPNVAEFGLWDAALSDAEVVSLARGASCHLVRNSSLVTHLPLVRSNVALRGGLTETGTVAAANTHPPIIGAIAA